MATEPAPVALPLLPGVEPPEPPRSGRRSKLTPAVHEQLVAAVEKGHHLRDAAALAGISYESLRSWRQRGREEMERREAGHPASRQEKRYLDLAQGVDSARATVNEEMTTTLRDLVKDKDTPAAVRGRLVTWWLERAVAPEITPRQVMELEGDMAVREVRINDGRQHDRVAAEATLAAAIAEADTPPGDGLPDGAVDGAADAAAAAG